MYSTTDESAASKLCEWCGESYTPSRFTAQRQRFCCTACSDQWHYAQPRHEYTCQHCGKLYHTSKPDRGTFCSRECAYAHRAEIANAKAEEAKPKPRPCEQCGAEFMPAWGQVVLCSDDCHKARERERARKDGASKHQFKQYTCKECGQEFTPEYGNKKRTFCSKECGKRFGRRQRRQTHGHSFGSRARNVLRSIYGEDWRSHYESINRRKVFERDGWRCQICGARVKQTKAYHPKQATIDHIIALSVGGSHTYSNVQTACQACNTGKGSEGGGQLRLL